MTSLVARAIFLGVSSAPLGASSAAGGGGTEPPSFARDVRPLLAEHCFECHGPDAAHRKAELRLDLSEGLAARASSGRLVVAPGDPSASELVRRIESDDPERRMPPQDFRHQLDARERAVLADWIAAGAPWEMHWSYRPLAALRAEGDLIDRRLDERAAAAGVTPAPEADRRTLARRLYLDLLGLPPSPADVARFLADERPDAVERLVDELLVSPHHAERLAVFWLDLVRYADTVGYHGDQAWSVWPYRDWVLDAFARNMPFDRFTVAQVAGDLLPDATLDDRVAATYDRLNMVTFEGGSQPKEFLLKYAADRVRTTSMAWLGSTMGCAECHDHKFDPFTTRDFYRFAAFFADIEEQGVYTRFEAGDVPPRLSVPSPTQAAEQAALAAEQDALLRTLAERGGAPLEGERRAWARSVRAELATPARDWDWVVDGPPAGATREGVWRVEGGERAQAGAEVVQHFFQGASRPVVLRAGDAFQLHVRIDPDDPPRTLMLQVHAPEWNHRAYWGDDAIPFGVLGSDGPDHHRLGDLPPAGEWVRLEVSPADLGLGPGSVVDGLAFTQFGGAARWRGGGLRTRSVTLAEAGAGPDVEAAVASAWRRPEGDAFARFYAGWTPTLAPLRAERDSLAARRAGLEAAIPSTLATVAGMRRETRVRPRGNWMDDSGEVVQPGVPLFLPQLAPRADGAAATRLDLARWLVSPENPLTARVFVNRVWALFFGEGLSRSLDDFGAQGAPPDDQALLDALAADFVASGWDVRALVRRIVTSRAYRRASLPDPHLRAADPENRLFARQSRRRLDAEFVRDAALASSGLLVLDVGGPSVKPYQPAGYWAQLNFPRREWQHDTGPDLYRRGLYTFWCRTFLHPTLKAFDAPAREECTARRARSNTPLQALALLDDPTFVEAARVLAERLLFERDGDAARLDLACERVLSRPARPDEAALCLELLARARARYAADPDAARALATVGERPPDPALDAAEVASWTAVTRVLLNSGEALQRR